MTDITLQHAVQAAKGTMSARAATRGWSRRLYRSRRIHGNHPPSTLSSPRPTRHPAPNKGALHDDAQHRARHPLQRAGRTADELQETLDAIKRAELFWISTVRPDGRPHVTPLVAVWLDEALHFSTGAGEQKALNLASNPRVALTTGADDWQSGLDVVVEGRAVRLTDPEQLQRLAAAWAQKWDGRWRYSVDEGGFRHDAGTALVFAVRPAKVLAFAKGGFSHTRHRF